ncbi:MAG: hypothetical protein HUJ25_12965 [Crocinitomicaceae bacterium]|nr:hypothetical protein [Crocinitomicaceae bacterium]
MKLIVATVTVILMLSFIGCSPSKKYKTEIEEIDSSLAVLNEIEADLNGIEFDSLQMMVDHVLRNEDSLKKYYHPDTLSLEIGKRMNECKGIRKSLKNLDSKEMTYRNEVEALKTQFTNLKTDIENGVLGEEKIKEALAEEKEALRKLNLSFHDFYILQEREKKYYYSAVPVIDELLVQLKNEAQQE